MLYQLCLLPFDARLWISDTETVLEALLRQGFTPAMVGCEQGHCKTCEYELLSGDITYLHEHLREPDELLLACQSLAQSDLVISWPTLKNPLDLAVLTLPAQITQKNQLADDIWQLHLEPQDTLFDYLPGQYLLLKPAGFEAQAYSIANAPLGEHHIELHLRHHEGQAFTQALFDAFDTQAIVQVTGPFGKAIYQPQPEHPMLLVVGGTGFAQGKALLEAHLTLHPQEPVHLFWVARSEHELYLRDLLTQWQAEYPAFQFTPIVSRPQGSDWQGHSERIYHVVTQYYPDLSQTQIYASGPQGLILDALNTFMQHGMPKAWMIADILS